jgi:peptidoglycan/xylan/chitin deacetylase (PgdA/CDA1 family)
MNSSVVPKRIGWILSMIIIALCFFAVPQHSKAATNLLPNPGFETADPSNGSRPQGWITGRWGTNTTAFIYPASGASGSKAASISMTSRTSGDAKWTTQPVAIQGGKKYEYSDTYMSDVTTQVTLEIMMNDGSLQYPDIGTAPAASSWTAKRFEFTLPTNAKSVRVFHLINQAGTLTIDDAVLAEVTSEPPPDPPDDPPPADPGNLINNPSLETAGATANVPLNWKTGRWGTNTTLFTYPVSGHDGAKGARIQITSYTNGDAKWYFDAVPVTAGSAYEFSDYYKATVPMVVSVQFKKSDGTFSYLDIGKPAAASDWMQFKNQFSVPAGVVALTVFHVINRTGTLDVDTFSLKKLASDPTKFDKGYISLNFDDGWLSVYENAIPILDEAGFKSNQYITTDYLTANYPGYVKPTHVLDMQSRGHTIGAHTKSHPNLTSLSTAAAQDEIAGSRQILLDLGARPVSTFAYPLGAYNDSIKQIVKNSGFTGARSSDGGYNDKKTDQYALRRFSMENTTTFDQVRGYIDTALANRTWAILLFHEVDTNGHRYAVTPELLEQIVAYLKQKGVTPITIEEGLAKMRQ